MKNSNQLWWISRKNIFWEKNDYKKQFRRGEQHNNLKWIVLARLPKQTKNLTDCYHRSNDYLMHKIKISFSVNWIVNNLSNMFKYIDDNRHVQRIGMGFK